MIDKRIYSQEYIEKVLNSQKCDPTILERSIFAFGLLEALVTVGAKFTFKGGTSLMLLLGDKLTAFAPHTIGVKPITEYEDRIIDKKIEVIKQFFDVASLYDVAKIQSEITESYYKTAEAEIRYRGLDITPEECLKDTFASALSIYSKGKFDKEDYKGYLFGIKGLGGFLINIKFNGETAFRQAAKIMHLASCIINKSSIQDEIPESEPLTGEYSKLNQTRKIDKKSFDMMEYSVRLFDGNNL